MGSEPKIVRSFVLEIWAEVKKNARHIRTGHRRIASCVFISNDLFFVDIVHLLVLVALGDTDDQVVLFESASRSIPRVLLRRCYDVR